MKTVIAVLIALTMAVMLALPAGAIGRRHWHWTERRFLTSSHVIADQNPEAASGRKDFVDNFMMTRLRTLLEVVNKHANGK